MSLPRLPDLPDINNIDNNKKPQMEKAPEKTEKVKPKNKPKKTRPRIPKSEYDENGKPILMAPDIDDIKLTDEIDKYFGNYEEGD